MEVYDYMRAKTGKSSPNEAEFRAYQLLVLVRKERHRVRAFQPPRVRDSVTWRTRVPTNGLLCRTVDSRS